jgi:superfamily I DNA/RNA helicase
MNAANQHSPQQLAVFDFVLNGEGHCIVRAVAGDGKTSTLVHTIVNHMTGNRFFGAFSKNIVTEIAERVHGAPGVYVNTFHAEGFQNLKRAIRCNVTADKCRKIFQAAAEGHEAYKQFEGVVLKLTSLAKQEAIGITTSIDDYEAWLKLVEHHDLDVYTQPEPDGNYIDNTRLIIQLAIRLLKMSNDHLRHGEVDFDDMIYGPLLLNVKLTQYDWVLIDEAQDTNKARRLMAIRMLKPTGRLMAVGDDRQAIFGFAGADADSMELKTKLNALGFTLFRLS